MDILALFGNLVCFILHVTNTDSFPAPLSKKEEENAVERLMNGDKAARDELVEHNLRLVAHIIKKYYSNYDDQDDLISIGTIGLIKAINTFNPEKGSKLATYAARCIENEILMYFRSMKKSSQDISLTDPIDTDSEGNPLTLMDIIYIDDTVVEDIDTRMKLKAIAGIIGGIKNPRDKEIIVKRYGLNGEAPQTQKEVAKSLDISRSYVSRIEKRILGEIRKSIERQSPQ